jgi:hypothetical protein
MLAMSIFTYRIVYSDGAYPFWNKIWGGDIGQAGLGSDNKERSFEISARAWHKLVRR